MGSKVLVLVAAALLLVPVAAWAQPVTIVTGPSLGLGFGPFSVEPASVGLPVYAPGDQLWVQSYENASSVFLTLTLPSTTGLSVSLQTILLPPGGLVRLYTFKASDPLGNWSLDAADQTTGATALIPILLANASSPLVPSFTGANLTGNSLLLGYSLPPTSAYDIQECTMGASAGSQSTLQLPGGSGALRVSLDGATAHASAPGAPGPVTGWFQLYASRTFQTGQVMSSELTLAAQNAGVFTAPPAPGQTSVPLTPAMSLRDGRYDLRVFVNGPSGVVSFDRPYLKVNATGWVALGGCTQVSAVTSSTFVMTTNLAGSNSTWPRLLYTMYSEDGVDSYTVSTVPTVEGRVDVRAASKPVGIQGTTFQASGAGLLESEGFNSALYVIGNAFPLKISVAVTFEGVATRSYDVTIPSPFSTVPLPVQVGTLAVSTLSGRSPLANATVSVSAGGEGASFHSDGAGNVTLTLPPGEYNVTASYQGRSVSETAQVQAGGTADVSLGFARGVPFLLYSLVAVLVAAVALDVFVWRAYFVRRSL